MPNHSLRMFTPQYLNLIGPTLQQLSQNRVVDRVSPDLAMQLNLGKNQAATVEAIVEALAPGGRIRRSTPHQERRRLSRHRLL